MLAVNPNARPPMLRCRRIWCGGCSPISTLTLRALPVGSSRTAGTTGLYGSGMGSSRRLPRPRLGRADSSRMSSAGCPGSPRGCPCPVPYPERTGVPGRGFPTAGAWCPTCRAYPRRKASFFDPAGAAAVVGGFLGALHLSPRPGGRAGQPVPRHAAGRAGGQLRGHLALLTSQAGIKPAGTRSCACRTRRSRPPAYGGPPALAARRPAPGEHPW